MALQMILVTDPDKPLELTAKGSARRNICLAKYEIEIDELYRAIEESSLDAPEPPSEWTPETTLEYVRAIVYAALQQSLEETDDFFQHGCDRYARLEPPRCLRCSQKRTA
jgi:hypothetical protein